MINSALSGLAEAKIKPTIVPMMANPDVAQRKMCMLANSSSVHSSNRSEGTLGNSVTASRFNFGRVTKYESVLPARGFYFLMPTLTVIGQTVGSARFCAGVRSRWRWAAKSGNGTNFSVALRASPAPCRNEQSLVRSQPLITNARSTTAKKTSRSDLTCRCRRNTLPSTMSHQIDPCSALNTSTGHSLPVVNHGH